jgi:dienelactone hydrolase
MKEATKDPKVLMERFTIALDLLKQQPQVDTQKIGAIGYCFGGGVVLAMARSGADLTAVATFHGHLSPDSGPVAQKGKVKPKILVQTGGADAMVPKDQVEAFKKEMADAGVDAKVVTYPNAKHSFTNPNAGKAGMKELAYDADTDKKSWAELLKFFKQTLGS